MKTLDELIHEYVDELANLYILQGLMKNPWEQKITVKALEINVEASVYEIMPTYCESFMDMLHYFADRISRDEDERDSMHFRLYEFLSYMFSYLQNPANRVN